MNPTTPSPASRVLGAIGLVLFSAIGGTCGDNGAGTCPGGAARTGQSACPGETIALDSLGATASRSPTLGCGGPSVVPYCGSFFGAEAVYSVTPKVSGTLHVKVAQPGATLLAYQADQCGKTAKTAVCKHDANDIYLAATAGKPHAIVLQGAAGDDYDVSFTLEPPACGNGLVEAGEACDTGKANAPESGCVQCKIEKPADDMSGLTDECSKTAVPLVSGKPQSVTSFTSSDYHDDVQACGSTAGGIDRVFAFTPLDGGPMKVSVTAPFDAVLAVFVDCPSLGQLDGLLRCADDTTSGAESVSFTAVKNQPYYLVVDGYGPASYGPFTLTVSLN